MAFNATFQADIFVRIINIFIRAIRCIALVMTKKTPRRGEWETLSCTILQIEAPGLAAPRIYPWREKKFFLV